MKHTQGKWEVESIRDIPEYVVVGGNFRTILFWTGFYDRPSEVSVPEREANAKLIAAAPALLKLAGNYLSDVECRIQSIKHDRDNNECAQHDPDVYDGYFQQIVHWAATAHHVEQVIKQAESGQ